MKKIQIVAALVAIVALAGFALFKTLTNSNDHGKENTENDSEAPGSAIEETRPQGSQEARTGIDP